MSVTIESSRFGTLQIPEEATIEFPLGLIGLEGSRYGLVDRNPGSGFQWLHSLEDPHLALPVVDPRQFFPSFTVELGEEDRQLLAADGSVAAGVYVTVRAAPDPADIVVNLRAPLLVSRGRGFQVLNTAPGADLKAPLFAATAPVARQPAVDAA
jgi:flagellar assembly factor FliW